MSGENGKVFNIIKEAIHHPIDVAQITIICHNKGRLKYYVEYNIPLLHHMCFLSFILTEIEMDFILQLRRGEQFACRCF